MKTWLIIAVIYTTAGLKLKLETKFNHESWQKLFKVINNSSSLNKGNYDRYGVWLYDRLVSIEFYDFISPFSLSFRLRRYIKHSKQCLTPFPNPSKFVKNTPLHVVFSTLFSVFRNAVKHGHLWYITWKTVKRVFTHMMNPVRNMNSEKVSERVSLNTSFKVMSIF